MPFTTLDPHVALVIIDLQKGICAHKLQPHPATDVIARSVTLASAFRARALPIVLVTVSSSPAVRTDRNPSGTPTAVPASASELVPELRLFVDADEKNVFNKTTPGAFTRTGLEAYLRDLGITQVVLAGVSTSNGVGVTASQAYELDFHVSLPVDAMSDSTTVDHDHSLTRVFPKRAETGSTAQLVALLETTHTKAA